MALVGLAVALLLVACSLQVAHSGRSPVPARAPDTLRIATLNVHYIDLNAADGPWSVAGWEARKAALDGAVKAVDADVFAFQEMESFSRGSEGGSNLTLDYLLAQNPGLAAAAVGDWQSFPSTQPILYRRAALRPLEQGWFFFSPTPEVIYSRTFDGSWPAFATWVAFERLADGTVFHVYNVHFEYKSRSNRQLSAALVADRIAPEIGDGGAVFLAGDTNARAGARTMAILQDAGLTFAPVDGATYHFNRGLNLFGAIDHIGHAGPASPQGPPVVLRDRFGAAWGSDHYPVLADYLIGPGG
jgi:endonuclease/exonuclease/phosphatase family metal-dependent hydrolase